jgi:hypothetical protein
MGFESKVPTKKFGKASLITFGCPEMGNEEGGFSVVESVSVTSSFQQNQMLKNEVGISVGQVVGDPKVEITVSGCAEKAPFMLGEIGTVAVFVKSVEGGEDEAEGADDTKFLITSVKQDNSNEDFMKFEINGEFYHNVDTGEKTDIKRGAEEFPG